MKLLYVTTLLTLALAAFAADCNSSPMPAATYLNGYCGFNHLVNYGRQGGAILNPRGLESTPSGDLLLVDSGTSTLWTVWEDANGNAQSLQIGSAPGLNHAVRLNGGYVYASSDTTVYRWTYNGRAALGSYTVVLENMPPGGAHNTRTMEFDSNSNLYINIGSGNNIDSDASRAKVIWVSLNQAFPIQYASANVLITGTRNSVGLRFDSRGILWSAENSLELDPSDPNATNNPADEINTFYPSTFGKFFGYPYCYTEGWLANGGLARTNGQGPNTQWAVNTNSIYTDSWCQNPNNVVKPAFPIRAHEAPLDLIFYNGNTFPGLAGTTYMTSNHGANNRSISVYALNSDGSANSNVASLRRLVYGPYAWEITPVAMTVAPCKAYGQCLYFTSDANGYNNPGVYALAYPGSSTGKLTTSSAAPAPSTTSAAATPTVSGSASGACSNPSKCGTSACCHDARNGDLCYSYSVYSCVVDGGNGNTYLCSAGGASCAGNCYDPNGYTCANGQITQRPANGAAPTPSTTSAAAKPSTTSAAPTTSTTSAAAKPSTTSAATPTTSSSTQKQCANPSSCGAASCCATRNGDACYSPSAYTCTADFDGTLALCPTGTQACNGACYNPSNYHCTGGSLQPN